MPINFRYSLINITLPDNLAHVKLDIKDMARMEVPEFSHQSPDALRFASIPIFSRFSFTPFPYPHTSVITSAYDVPRLRLEVQGADQ